jgi:hypothetical protein
MLLALFILWPVFGLVTWAWPKAATRTHTSGLIHEKRAVTPHPCQNRW